jgi:Uma2 family endonuclease
MTTVEEYLHTAYQLDCDYVDGEIVQRNGGERSHSEMLGKFVYFFHTRRREWKTHVYISTRMRISETRYRVPAICVYVGEDAKDQIFRTPPYICIEVLSPEDRFMRIRARIDDYLKFGVAYVLVSDPATRRVWTFTTDGSREIKDGVLRTDNPSLTVDLAEIFSGIDG